MSVRMDAAGDDLVYSNIGETTLAFVCWFRIVSYPAGFNSVFNLDDGSGPWYVGYSNLGATYMEHNATSTGSIGELTTATWYGLAGVRNITPNPDEVRAWFFNASGGLIATRSIDSNQAQAAGADIVISRSPTWGDRHNGRIDGLKMWTTLADSTTNNNREWLRQELFSYMPFVRTDGAYAFTPCLDSNYDTVDLSGQGNTPARGGTLTYEAGAPIVWDREPHRGLWITAAAPPAGIEVFRRRLEGY